MKSDDVTDRIDGMRINPREARSELIGPSASLWLTKKAEAESWALAEATMSGDTAHIAAAAPLSLRHSHDQFRGTDVKPPEGSPPTTGGVPVPCHHASTVEGCLVKARHQRGPAP